MNLSRKISAANFTVGDKVEVNSSVTGTGDPKNATVKAVRPRSLDVQYDEGGYNTARVSVDKVRKISKLAAEYVVGDKVIIEDMNSRVLSDPVNQIILK